MSAAKPIVMSGPDNCGNTICGGHRIQVRLWSCVRGGIPLPLDGQGGGGNSILFLHSEHGMFKMQKRGCP